MTPETFSRLIEELRANSFDTLIAKNENYAHDADKLHNFHNGANIMGGTPAQAAWGYLTKHLVSLRDKIQRNDFSDREDFLEKCQDTINYVCLIWCIGNEENEKLCTAGAPKPDEPEEPEEDYSKMSYRDVVMRRFPDKVGSHFHGGVCGCPYDYFHVPPDITLCPDCEICWRLPYKGEKIREELCDAP